MKDPSSTNEQGKSQRAKRQTTTNAQRFISFNRLNRKHGMRKSTPNEEKWFQQTNQTLNTSQDGTKYQRKDLSSKDIRHDMDQKML